MNEPGADAGRYRLERELGRRAGVVTWRSTDRESGAAVTVKEFSLRAAGFAQSQAAFEEQAAILARLRHPGIPAFMGFSCREEGSDVRCRLVQEFVEGESLAARVEGGRRLAAAEVLALLAQAAEVLAYLHGFAPPLVHRDIRPANLILGTDGALRLTDFDFRTAHDPPPPGDAALLPWLTSGFAPPEASRGEWTPASDIFSLGMTALYALTGREPRLSEDGEPLAVREQAELPDRLARVLERMVDPDPARRFRSGADLAAALQGPAPETRRSGRGRRIALAWAAIALAGIAIHRLWPEERRAAPRVSRPAIAVRPAPPARPAAPRPRSAPAAPPATTIPASGGMVEGRLYFDGRPVREATARAPVFWFRNESRNVVEKPEVRHADGSFRIVGLPAGEIGMSVRIDLDRENPPVYPGDLDAWTVLRVPEAGTLPVDVPLRKVIRLREPVDNDLLLAGGKVPCGGGYVLRSPVRFRWEPVADGGGVEYALNVDRMNCGRNYNTVENTFQAVTGATAVSIPLPPSREGECYGFRLHARRGDVPVGMFTTHGESYLAWDFRFTVGD